MITQEMQQEIEKRTQLKLQQRFGQLIGDIMFLQSTIEVLQERLNELEAKLAPPADPEPADG